MQLAISSASYAFCEAALDSGSTNPAQNPAREPSAHAAVNPPHAPAWTIDVGNGPVVATAIHAGHEVRPDVAEWMAISAADRLREEDPMTGFWTSVGDSSIRVYRSRFEMDLNRPREKAIAVRPEDCWGLHVWRESLPEAILERSLGQYDSFYREVGELLDSLVERWNSVLVLDLHSYNYRRAGPDKPGDSVLNSPEVNVGTGTMDRDHWTSLVDTFVTALRNERFRNRPLDVRENVKFMGGHFPSWVHSRYPRRVCVLSLEFKKFFMDEWGATANIAALEELRVALRNATNATRPALEALRGRAGD
jgi:N-formylglutamate amidohydrolase